MPTDSILPYDSPPPELGDLEALLATRSGSMSRVVSSVRSVAGAHTTVLLTGETGTGKGVIARAIHTLGPHHDGPFVAVHCGAMAESLIESELFGHERGAFTGAVRRKLGKFELARGGTLFLDEVGTISQSVQVKLLQVLQERVFQRVGGESDIAADVRLIAATNSDLGEMRRDGRFRSDLYYRLSVFPIEVPPLRERLEDIPLLVARILGRLNGENTKAIRRLQPEVMQALGTYPWPGNIRELENVLERAYVLEPTTELTADSFPPDLFADAGVFTNVPVDTAMTLAEARRAAVESVERRYLSELLSTHDGRIDRTAAAAGITPRQLHKLLARHSIRKEEYRKPGRRPGRRVTERVVGDRAGG